MKDAPDLARRFLTEALNSYPPNPDADPRTPEYLRWLAEEVIRNGVSWEIDRQHRAVGFIESGLIATGLATLEQTRQWIKECPDCFPKSWPRMNIPVG